MRKLVNRFKKLKNERGLTLVELLAVIVILAIIAIIAFVMIGNVMENSRKDAHIANAQQLIAAAKLYDATEEPIDTITSKKLHEKGYLDPLIDPWEKEKGTYKGTVTKTVSNNGVEFKVTLHGKKCNIVDASEAQLAKGRDEVCKQDQQTGTEQGG